MVNDTIMDANYMNTVYHEQIFTTDAGENLHSDCFDQGHHLYHYVSLVQGQRIHD
jgi:hypothetical protein